MPSIQYTCGNTTGTSTYNFVLSVEREITLVKAFFFRMVYIIHVHFTKGASSLRICYLRHSTSSRVMSKIRDASSWFNVPLISLTYSNGEDTPTQLAD